MTKIIRAGEAAAPVRATTPLNRLLDLPGIAVRGVSFPAADTAVAQVAQVAQVALRHCWLACPRCDYSTRARYDTRPVTSTWRHLDLGRWQLQLSASLRRRHCPTHAGCGSKRCPSPATDRG